jgi:hypothetical protein
MGAKTGERSAPGRIDWKAERGRVDLAAVATRWLGPAPGRRGERGRKLWWSCPLGTHEDDNPSFCVVPGSPWWRCFGCGEKGDAATLVRRLEEVSFPEALKLLVGGDDLPRTSGPRPRPKPAAAARPEPMGREVLDLVAEAERRLWSPAGSAALAYLVGRGLTGATIRAARLGVTGRGITIPWFDGPDLRMVNVRRPDGSDPRYKALPGSHRGGLYPGPEAIIPGLPAVIVEGEMDRMLVAQELAGLASVVTLGGAAEVPTAAVREELLPAWPWYIATDADLAGDLAAARWPSSARRARPPGAFKDWGEAHLGGIVLRRWWTDRLAGEEPPPLFTWDELRARRWGPGLDDDEPSIDLIRPVGGPDDRAPASSPPGGGSR